MKPTVAPTLDTSLHIRREVCRGCREARGEKTGVSLFSLQQQVSKIKLCPNFILDPDSKKVLTKLGVCTSLRILKY